MRTALGLIWGIRGKFVAAMKRILNGKFYAIVGDSPGNIIISSGHDLRHVYHTKAAAKAALRLLRSDCFARMAEDWRIVAVDVHIKLE